MEFNNLPAPGVAPLVGGPGCKFVIFDVRDFFCAAAEGCFTIPEEVVGCGIGAALGADGGPA